MNDIWPYVLIIGGMIALATPFFVIGINQARRAQKGLRLISDSDIHPLSKMQLLHQWMNPYATKEQFTWLEETIKKLEEKTA